MKDNTEKISPFKAVIFSLIPLAILFLLIEGGLRVLYFQQKAENPLAVMTVYHHLRNKLLESRAQAFREHTDIRVVNDLFTEEHAEPLLKEFTAEYEENFRQLADSVSKIDSVLLVLYLPSDMSEKSQKRETCRAFFRGLAEKYDVRYLDLTEALLSYPMKQITLFPQNMHLSRFGNIIIAEQLSDYIENNIDHRSEHKFESVPKLLGDIKPNHRSMWRLHDKLPYEVITNSQGLRMEYEITPLKKKRRILALGDSFTFGPYLRNWNTYPALLDEKLEGYEVINAGVCGYTIEDELSLFIERAQYCQPDITILQVLDNDLTGFFTFKRNLFNREKKHFEPSDKELSYIKKYEIGGDN